MSLADFERNPPVQYDPDKHTKEDRLEQTVGTLRRNRRYPWKDLKVGGQFFVAGKTPSRLGSARAHAEKTLGRQFNLKKADLAGHGSGTLVTRTA